jgi:Kef-type K+ transport system membrane component KefB
LRRSDLLQSILVATRVCGLAVRPLGQPHVVGELLWALALVVLGAVVVGKLGGSALAARVGGVPWREAAALGVLMNTRGLMELVILNVGLDLGVLSPALFAIFVLMALLTTLMTSPLLSTLGVPAKTTPASRGQSSA